MAANALGIVSRELKLGPAATLEEWKRLTVLLGHEGLLEELNRDLCKEIRDGAIDLETKGLKEHLDLTTRDKVAIDQPTYSGLRQALKR